MKNTLRRTVKLWIYTLVMVFVFSMPVQAAEAGALPVIPYVQSEPAAIPGIGGEVYAVLNATTGQMLYSNNGDRQVLPASCTKLVTAMVILDRAPLDQVIAVSQETLDRVPSDATQLHLKAGSKYTVLELMLMFLNSSAADAGQILVEGCFGSVAECVAQMNALVVKLGLKNTVFDNPVGLDIGNGYQAIHTTANDFARLAQLAMTYDAIRQIVCLPAYGILENANNPMFLEYNTNRFYKDMPYSANLYTVIGSKTGSTKNAGYALTTTATNGTTEIICISFSNKTPEERYTNTRQLLDYTFMQLLAAGQ